MRTSLAVPMFLLLALSVSGCGGGGSQIDSPTQNVQTFSSRGITAGYVAATGVKPMVVGSNSSGAVFMGVYGVNFTTIQTNQVATLKNTRIYFSHHGELWSMDPNGQDIKPVRNDYSFLGNDAAPSISPNGRVAAIIVTTNTSQLVLVGLDGSFTQLLSTPGLNPGDPVYSPSGSTILFDSYDPVSTHEQIYSIGVNGTGLTKLSDGTADEYYPAFTRDGKIVFNRLIAGTYTPYSMNANGSSPAPNSQFLFTHNTAMHFAQPPTGPGFAQSLGAGGIGLMSSVGGTSNPPPATASDDFVSYSPDGRYLIWKRTTSSIGTIYRMDFDGSNPITLTDGVFDASSPTWGPFPQTRNVVGSGGAFGTNASGFLAGTTGDTIESFVAYAALTPSSASIVPEVGGSNASNAVFQLKGDSITRLSYVNDIFASPTVVVPANGLATVGGALVTFSTNTGKVVFVIPYSPAAPKRAPGKTNQTVEYTGRFVGIWDAHGKNVAPKGASRVVLDTINGKVVSFS